MEGMTTVEGTHLSSKMLLSDKLQIKMKAKSEKGQRTLAEGLGTQCHLFTKLPFCASFLGLFVSAVRKTDTSFTDTGHARGLISECLPAIWKMKSVYC